jgi:histidinol dehydrogenase
MEIIEGFTAAKVRLTRKPASGAEEVSSEKKSKSREALGVEVTAEQSVARIISDVRERGDAALREYNLKFDGVKTDSLEISREQIKAAYNHVDKELIAALRFAAERIRKFHQEQKDAIWHGVDGEEWGQIIRPLERVGFYVPGGTAPLPSSVLATLVPAKVAGVKNIILATPPRADFGAAPETLVAADIAGVDRVFGMGGAQAIAALAYGTESVPRVDKICGPGNIYVMLAKKQVFGAVDIDALQGPSEVLVIADEKARAEYCAADLLAQAEHDEMAQAIFITTSRKLAEAVIREIEQQLKTLPRRKIAAGSLRKYGAVIVVSTLDEAINLANLYAPEHLELMVEDAGSYAEKVVNAGCVFVGESSTEPIGDYVAGPSHVLPTGGTARFSSPLNILDFIKIIDVVKVNKSVLKKLSGPAMTIARAEGLEAHARAVERRVK